MNILVVVPKLSGKGGTETVLKSWSRNLTKFNNLKVTYVLPEGSKDKEWLSKIDNIILNSEQDNRLKKNISSFLFLKKIINNNYDIIICLSSKMINFTNYFKKKYNYNFKIVSWIHFSLSNKKVTNMKWVKYADFHLAISNGIKEQLENYKIKKERIFVIGNPISRKKENISQNCMENLKLIYIGRVFLKGQKNLEQILRVFPKLNFDWELHIYGDGPDLAEMKNLCRTLNMFDNIFFHGWLNEPFNNIEDADYVVLPSLYEGFPMVLLEALSYGIPCISSNCPTGPQDIINNENGFLFKTNDDSSFLEALIKAYRNKSNYEKDKIKCSISKFYEDQYFNLVNKIFLKIGEK